MRVYPPSLSSSNRFTPYLTPAAVLVQLLLILYTFSKLIFHPGEYLIVNHYDGIKTYFSVESFLRQPLSDGLLVRGHNYPFGEYLFYTDGTPLVIIPLHLLIRAVPALQPYGLYLYDLFMLGGLAVSTWLVCLILRPLSLPAWLAFLLSIVLPWLSPQTYRFVVGHASLAYAPASLFSFWALQQLYLARSAGRPGRKWFVVLAIGIVAASYIHLYFLALLGALSGFFFLFWIGQEILAHRPWRRLAIYASLTLLTALVTTTGILMLLDPRYHERSTGSGGYDYIDWKFQFSALFKGYIYNTVRFPLERTDGIPYESVAYLTAFVLYALLVMAILALLRRLPKVSFSETPGSQFLLLFLLASVPLVLISLGEVIVLDNGAYILHNYINPFFWLHKLTERVTQFRALGRFIWPFWWALALAVSWCVARWRQRPVLRWLLAALALLLLVDLRDAVRFYRDTQVDNLLTARQPTQHMTQFLAWLDPKPYQAILPFPLYHVGSEGGTPSYTVDPDDPHCNRTYQLSCLTNLPLMSHKAARTPPEQGRLIMTITQPGGPDPALLARLDARPILVYLDSAYYDGQSNYYRDGLKDRPEVLALFNRAAAFIQEQHMTRIRHEGSMSLYEWYPKGPPK